MARGFASLTALLVASFLKGTSAVGVWTVEDVFGKAFNGTAPKWSYRVSAQDGPSNWRSNFPGCDTPEQSPINLSYRGSQFAEIPPLQFINWDSLPQTQIMLNNGHTLQVTLSPEKSQLLTGGLLPGTFVFAQYHFHWGSDDTSGSEHTIDFTRFPLELHMVFYNTRYDARGGLREATKQRDGLAVVAVMFVTSNVDNPALEPIVRRLRELIRPDSNVTSADAVPLGALLPLNRNRMFVYHGSLTTPTCEDTVTWTVLDHGVFVSSEQLRAFRALEDNDRGRLQDNFRPTQPQGSRIVLRNFH